MHIGGVSGFESSILPQEYGELFPCDIVVAGFECGYCLIVIDSMSYEEFRMGFATWSDDCEGVVDKISVLGSGESCIGGQDFCVGGGGYSVSVE